MGKGVIVGQAFDTTNLFIARHGQTKWNVEHRIQGKSDSPLTKLGVKQALQLGKRLADIGIDVIFSSSSRRAFRTAQIVSEEQKSQIPLYAEKDLMEISLGEWEGMLRSEIDQLYPRMQDIYFNNPTEFRPVGNGETFFQVRDRVLAFLDRVLEKNAGKNILLVTHTAVVKLILGHFEGRSLENLWDPPIIRPASLSHIMIGEIGPVIKSYGDTGHFRAH